MKPAPHKPGKMAHIYNPRTCEVEAEGSGVKATCIIGYIASFRPVWDTGNFVFKRIIFNYISLVKFVFFFLEYGIK